MTILVAFAGVINQKPASLYFLADSRISWGESICWDHAQKVFSSRRTSEIFAFCGDVVFPTQTLGQLIQLSEKNVLFKKNTVPKDKVNIYCNIIQKAFEDYPKGAINSSYTIIYGTVYSNKLYCFSFGYRLKDKSFFLKQHNFPKKSDFICIEGSGKKSFKNFNDKEQTGDWENTTRGVFNAFCKNLKNNKIDSVGGYPQLVSIFPNGATNIYGISIDKNESFLGLQADFFEFPEKISWRNENFEIWDPIKKALKKGAQPQPQPRSK